MALVTHDADSGKGTPERPADVVTGFWLWVVALPLMLTGYVCDALATGGDQSPALVGATIMFALVLAALVATFLMLMRSGYGWARTLLTGGGVATIFYTMMSVFNVERPMVAAVVFAVTGIVGSVLIGGGMYLLHRRDSQGFFTR